MEREIIVSNRSVYHKYTQIKVKVPTHVKDADIDDWLIDNEDKWKDDMDKKISRNRIRVWIWIRATRNVSR